MDLLFSKINISFTIWYQLFRREFLVKNKIQFDEALLVSEDLDLKMETLVKAQHIDVINSYIYVYRMPNENRNSLTLKKYTGEDLIPTTNMFLKWYHFFDGMKERMAGQEMMRKKFAFLSAALKEKYPLKYDAAKAKFEAYRGKAMRQMIIDEINSHSVL